MKVAEWKIKQSQARIVENDPQIVLRRILLNSLINGPVPKEKVIASANRQFGFKREDVLRATMWWNCVEEMRQGEVHWSKPNVLVALPRWHYGRTPQAPSKPTKPRTRHSEIWPASTFVQ
jgi:hypothetical protein